MLRFSLCLPKAPFQRDVTSLLLRLSITGLLGFNLIGCGGGGGGSAPAPTPPAPTPTAPAISTQPSNQSVPMGLSASFTVAATGSSLTYQWSKGGTAITGATASSYTTPATAFADTSAAFTVAVSNSGGTVTSAPATLTVTGRAPAAGDLRFQQVDAPTTVNGYAVASGNPTSVVNAFGAYFAGYFGTPLYLTPSVCGAAAASGSTCKLQFQQFLLPSSLTSQGLSVGYGADVAPNLLVDLQSTTFPAGGNTLSSPNSVVTSLDLEPANNLFGVSWIQSSQTAALFDLMVQTVASTDLQTAATQEGAQHRVITSIVYNGPTQVVYTSYGWQSDTTTLYDTQVVTATSVAQVVSSASTLASQGYIITAIGGSASNNAYLLVGARVTGDSVARPFVSTSSGNQATALWQAGYATIGVLEDASGNITYLGER